MKTIIVFFKSESSSTILLLPFKSKIGNLFCLMYLYQFLNGVQSWINQCIFSNYKHLFKLWFTSYLKVQGSRKRLIWRIQIPSTIKIEHSGIVIQTCMYIRPLHKSLKLFLDRCTEQAHSLCSKWGIKLNFRPIKWLSMMSLRFNYLSKLPCSYYMIRISANSLRGNYSFLNP